MTASHRPTRAAADAGRATRLRRSIAAAASLDVLRAALDLRSITADRRSPPGGPTTIRAAIDQIRDRLDRLAATCPDLLDQPQPAADQATTQVQRRGRPSGRTTR